jgi:alanyl-tRNA synthetase
MLPGGERIAGVYVLAVDVPRVDAAILRTLGDQFRAAYPKESIMVLVSGTAVLSAVSNDVVAQGIKAGDLIEAIGGRGGGRPNMAQGSLPDGLDPKAALKRVAGEVRAKLK